MYAYARDPEWGRALLLPVPEPYVRRNAEEFVARTLLASWSTDPHFAIVLDTTVIGGINLTVDKPHEIAGLGYAIAKPHWGKGLAPEAATAVFDWAFAHHGLAKIYARADLRNRRSTRVMEKLGMTREGVLRSHRKGPRRAYRRGPLRTPPPGVGAARRGRTAMSVHGSGGFKLIRAARLIDGNGGPPLERGAILIEGDVIRAVGTEDAVAPPEGARVEKFSYEDKTVLPTG